MKGNARLGGVPDQGGCLFGGLGGDDSAGSDFEDAGVGAKEGARDFIDVNFAGRQASKVVLQLEFVLVERTFQGIDSRVRMPRCWPTVLQDLGGRPPFLNIISIDLGSF